MSPLRRLSRWFLPWPTPDERKAAVEAARIELEQARAQRRAVEADVEYVARLRERNHFRQAFEANLRRDP